MAEAIWSQKDMRSPSGGEARHRGGTHIGKAPPSPEMTISGLTRGRFVGDDDVAKQIIFPGFAGRAARPFRRAVSFLGSNSPKTQRKSLCGQLNMTAASTRSVNRWLGF